MSGRTRVINSHVGAGPKQRSDVIDGFRAIAIFIVLLYHYLVRWTPPLNPIDYYGFVHVYSSIFALGEYGVHIFFVISGLVIAMTIVKSQSAADFAIRRFARIYPAYFVATTLVAVTVMWSGRPFYISLKDYLTTLTMAAPHLGGQFVDGAYWSLLVEVKFYALAALSFIVLKNRFWMGLLALGVLGAIATQVAPRVADQILLVRFMPLFLIGMAGWYSIFNGQHRIGAILGVGGLILYAINARLVIGAAQAEELVLPAHVLILGGSMAMLALLRFCDGLRLGPLAYVGRASYSWYLVHQRIGVILIGMMTARGMSDLAAVAVAITVTIGLGCLLFEGVEKRAQRIVLHLWHHGRAHLLNKARIDISTTSLSDIEAYRNDRSG